MQAHRVSPVLHAHLLDGVRPGGHVDEEHDEEHHHGQRGQHHGGDLLPGLLHGLLPLLLVFGGFLLGFPLQLPHGASSMRSQR